MYLLIRDYCIFSDYYLGLLPMVIYDARYYF